MYDDLRYALRGLRGAKLTVGVLVASFAVGTGANAVLYRAMDALIFRPPAGVVQPARLVNVFTSGFGGGTYGLSSYPDFFSLERGTPALAALAAFDDSTVDVVHLEGTARRMRIVAAGPGFFPVLGVQASLGHVPRFDEHGPDAESAALSFDLWTTAGRPADIIGKRMRVGARGTPWPPSCRPGFAAFVWIAPAMSGFRWTWMPVAREAIAAFRYSGVSLVVRTSRLRNARRPISRCDWQPQFPGTNRGTRIASAEPRRMTVSAYSRVDPDSTQRFALLGLIVFSASSLLLVSACVNAGLILMSRSAARRRERAVKVALGASRATLVRQALGESLVISVGGAAAGLLLAYWTARIVPSFLATRGGRGTRYAPRSAHGSDDNRLRFRSGSRLHDRTSPSRDDHDRHRDVASRRRWRVGRRGNGRVSQSRRREPGGALHDARDPGRAARARGIHDPQRRPGRQRAQAGDCQRQVARNRERQGCEMDCVSERRARRGPSRP